MQSASGEGKVAPEALISNFEVEKLLKQGSKHMPLCDSQTTIAQDVLNLNN